MSGPPHLIYENSYRLVSHPWWLRSDHGIFDQLGNRARALTLCEQNRLLR